MIDSKIDTTTAFLDSFEGYGKSIYRYIYIRVGYRREVAEDLTQDVFEKVWKYRESFDPERSSMKTWIYTIARNTVTDFYRKKREEHSLPEVEGVGERDVPDLEKDEKLEIVLGHMKSMSDGDREILMLRYIEDMDLQEVADIIGKSYTSTKVAIHRAVNRLKEIINEDEEN